MCPCSCPSPRRFVPGLLPVVCGMALIGLSMHTNQVVHAQESDPENWDVTAPRGETHEIDFTTSEGTWMSVDLSADGEWVVFDLLGHVYRVPAIGGEAVLR